MDVVETIEHTDRWEARRLELIDELTREIRAKYPLVSWKAHAELVTAAVDMQLLYERFGNQP